MFRTRSLALTATAVAGIVALSACSSGTSSTASDEELTPFTLGTNSWVGYGPWYVAQEQGYLEDEGIDLEIFNYDEADYVALATTGQVDGINHSINDWLVNYNQHEFELVLLEDVSLTADAMIGGAGVDSVADLVGKEVAFGEGGVSALVYYDALAKNDIDPADITTVNLEPADAGNALIAGQVDSAVTYEPYVTTALTANPDSKVIYSAGETPGLISDGLFVSPEYAEEHPEVIEGLAAAWDKAVAFTLDNPEEAQTIIGEATGVPADQRETMFEGLEFYTLADSADMLADGGAFGADIMPSIQAAMLAAGILDAEVELGDDAIDTSYLTTVLDR
ncbi:ABC transporter substrate-binding protein [Mycetocola sp. 2940]|uniref:ABC transporter substrate-binding protein n=1 Tax=Mycetocola sp. 2940 TaxID=3156452 RepID=UPI00339A8216